SLSIAPNSIFRRFSVKSVEFLGSSNVLVSTYCSALSAQATKNRAKLLRESNPSKKMSGTLTYISNIMFGLQIVVQTLKPLCCGFIVADLKELESNLRVRS